MRSLFVNPDGARVSVIVLLSAESNWELEDLETAVTQVAILLLERAGLPWGTQAADVTQACGWTTAYDIAGAWVEIDAIRSALCVVATIWIDDVRTFEAVEHGLGDVRYWEFEHLLVPDDVQIYTGRSHPDTGDMTDAREAAWYERRRLSAFQRYDGPLVDDDGNPLEDVDVEEA